MGIRKNKDFLSYPYHKHSVRLIKVLKEFSNKKAKFSYPLVNSKQKSIKVKNWISEINNKSSFYKELSLFYVNPKISFNLRFGLRLDSMENAKRDNEKIHWNFTFSYNQLCEKYD